MTVYQLLESTVTRTTREEYEDSVSDVSFYYRSQMAPRSTSLPRRPAALVVSGRPGCRTERILYDPYRNSLGREPQ